MKTQKTPIFLERKAKRTFKERLGRAAVWTVHLSFIGACLFLALELRALNKFVRDSYIETVHIVNFLEENRPIWKALSDNGFTCEASKNEYARLEKTSRRSRK